MAVMYKIVEGESPRLPDHFHSDLKKLFSRFVRFVFVCACVCVRVCVCVCAYVYAYTCVCVCHA